MFTLGEVFNHNGWVLQVIGFAEKGHQYGYDGEPICRVVGIALEWPD